MTLLSYFCSACGGFFRSGCPHGAPQSPRTPSQYAPNTYCAKCGWWTSGCGH